MRSNSSIAGLSEANLIVRHSFAEFRRALPVRYPIESGIHKAGFIARKEIMGNADIFVDHYLGRHLPPSDQFEASGPQDGAQDRVHPGQRPAFGQASRNGLVDLCLMRWHALDN